MPPAPRTTVSLPRARFEQIEAIARHRGLPNAAAVIGAWISRAIQEGEIPPEFPGITCQPVGGGFLVSVHDKVLPTIPPEKARVLAAVLSAAVLSAAGGKSDPELSFAMTPGKATVMDLGDHLLVIARAGRGVRIVAKPKDGTESTLASVSPSFAVEMARQIREAFTGH
ncbi:MAG: hypothetical protein PGN25_07360 [Methylorubrum populi]